MQAHKQTTAADQKLDQAMRLMQMALTAGVFIAALTLFCLAGQAF